jgi:N6-L-threonylcarbamoyladenine synthase
MAAAVLRGGREILASAVRGQTALHRPYGGVVPEIASRDHVRRVSSVVAEALARAGVAADELDAVAATAGPGLVGSLLVGLSFAKALAYRLRIPLVAVHHLAGHLASAELAHPELAPPYVGLVISGGHTALYRIEALGPARLLGATRDDAVGEAFDKVARLLGLPYPGGPALSAVAERGDPGAIRLPKPMRSRAGKRAGAPVELGPQRGEAERSPIGKPGAQRGEAERSPIQLDFSFSGLKTAVALEAARRAPLDAAAVADLAAAFEAVAVGALVERARAAVEAERVAHLAVVGGVAANRRLRAELALAAARDGFRAVFPPRELCTDNAAMIAAAGARLLARGVRHGLDVGCFSRVPLGAAPW